MRTHKINGTSKYFIHEDGFCTVIKGGREVAIPLLTAGGKPRVKIEKPRKNLPQTNVSGSFKEWYLEFRNEMVKSFGVNYSISIASWTFSENHKHYYDSGLTPKEAVLEYAAS